MNQTMFPDAAAGPLRHGLHAGALDRTGHRSDLREPGRPCVVAEGQVHVWTCPPHEADASARAYAVLDDSERRRAAGFRFERDQLRFIAHHAFTRRVLARYAGVSAGALVLRAARLGKPEVEAAHAIDFSTSRSRGMSVVAVARGRVGVDIEAVRPLEDALELADGLFTHRERRFLRATPDASRGEAFLQLWTRKESIVKAFGVGLSAALDDFEVSPAGADQGAYHGRFATEGFVVSDLDVPSGWRAAVCLAGTQLAVRRMHLAAVAMPGADAVTS